MATDTEQQLSQYPADKNAKIVLYCRSERTLAPRPARLRHFAAGKACAASAGVSSIAAKELVMASYTNVWNLDGGMAAWEQQGFPCRKSKD